jgi:hypothetical protein
MFECCFGRFQLVQPPLACSPDKPLPVGSRVSQSLIDDNSVHIELGKDVLAGLRPPLQLLQVWLSAQVHFFASVSVATISSSSFGPTGRYMMIVSSLIV